MGNIRKLGSAKAVGRSLPRSKRCSCASLGHPIPRRQRPPFWSNGSPVHWREGQEFNPAACAAERLPLIEDFEVIIEGVISKHKLGKAPPFYFVWLFSPSRGYLTHILGADEPRDLAAAISNCPTAILRSPTTTLTRAGILCWLRMTSSSISLLEVGMTLSQLKYMTHGSKWKRRSMPGNGSKPSK